MTAARLMPELTEALKQVMALEPCEADLLTAHQEFLLVSGAILETLIEGQAASLMNSLVLGTHVPIGSRLLATKWVVDPAQAAFQHTLLMTWSQKHLDFYPGHHFLVVWAGAISIADYLSRKRYVRGQEAISIREVFECMAKMRLLYEYLYRHWPQPENQRWILKLLTGAASMYFMHKPESAILSLWNHLTYAGQGQLYPSAHGQELAWALGLDQHHTIMAAYSVVQTHSLFLESSMLCWPQPLSQPMPGQKFLASAQSIEALQKSLKIVIEKAYHHPELGHCEELLELNSPEKLCWDRSFSDLLTTCSIPT